MLLSAIYRILCVACLLYANFQLCCATDEVVDEQTARIFCMRNCSHLTKDVYTTQLSSENITNQSCYENCLQTFEWRCTKDCKEDGDGKYLAINPTCIDVFFYEENGSIYANVSWTCPHALELTNLKSYKLIYYWYPDIRSLSVTHCCREIEKTDTSAQMNISLHGLKEQEKIWFKVVPLERMHSDVFIPYSYWKVDLSNGLTDITPTDKPKSTLSEESSSSELYTAIACVTFILVIGSALIYWYRRGAGSARQDTDFEFDVFIIYNSADEEWVDKTLRRTLEEKHGLRCCVHYRDFTPGKPFRDNMTESVYKSKKTIAVVSHNFYKSDFCPEEMDIALHRSLQRGDDSVIVIKLDDVDKNKLPKALKERSYIDYEKWIVRETWEKKLIDSIKNPVKYKSSEVCFV